MQDFELYIRSFLHSFITLPSLQNPAEFHSQISTKTPPISTAKPTPELPGISVSKVSLVHSLNKLLFIPNFFGEYPNMSS